MSGRDASNSRSCLAVAKCRQTVNAVNTSSLRIVGDFRPEWIILYIERGREVHGLVDRGTIRAVPIP